MPNGGERGAESGGPRKGETKYKVEGGSVPGNQSRAV